MIIEVITGLVLLVLFLMVGVYYVSSKTYAGLALSYQHCMEVFPPIALGTMLGMVVSHVVAFMSGRILGIDAGGVFIYIHQFYLHLEGKAWRVM
jgi:hypothetical protein